MQLEVVAKQIIQSHNSSVTILLEHEYSIKVPQYLAQLFGSPVQAVCQRLCQQYKCKQSMHKFNQLFFS